MQRRSAIAVAGAVTGVLIAGSVASVAVINAASSSTAAAAVPIVAASVAVPESASVILPEPGAESAPLPEIVIPEPVNQAITAQAARTAATAATPGSVLDTSRVQRAGYDAYAVQIERADGSIVTGYVEATSGVVFDWVVDKKAPTPKATYQEYEEDEEHDEDHDEEHDEERVEDHDEDRDGDDD